MIKSTLSAAAIGLAIVSLSAPAMALPARFDPGLQPTPSPLLTDVQFPGGPGAQPMGGGGPRFGGGGRRLLPPGARNPGGFGGPGGQGRGGFGDQGRRFGGGDGGRRFDGDRGGFRRDRGGFGVGAGLAAGAIIGGALAAQSAPGYGYGDGNYGYGYGDDSGYIAPPQPQYDGYAQAAPADDDPGYCARRYKSFDPASGTYLGFDGLRHPCP